MGDLAKSFRVRVITYGANESEAVAMAAEVLDLAIAERMDRGEDIPSPRPGGPDEMLVSIRPLLAAKVALYHALARDHVSKSELARRLGVDDVVAGRIVGTNHLQHQVRAHPLGATPARIRRIHEQQQVRLAVLALADAQRKRGQQDDAAERLHACRERAVEELQDKLMGFGRHRGLFNATVGHLDVPRRVAREPHVVAVAPSALPRGGVAHHGVHGLLRGRGSIHGPNRTLNGRERLPAPPASVAHHRRRSDAAKRPGWAEPDQALALGRPETSACQRFRFAHSSGIGTRAAPAAKSTVQSAVMSAIVKSSPAM